MDAEGLNFLVPMPFPSEQMVKRLRPLDGFGLGGCWPDIIVLSHHPINFFLSKCHQVWEVDVGGCGRPEPPYAHAIPIGSRWLSGCGYLMGLVWVDVGQILLP